MSLTINHNSLLPDTLAENSIEILIHKTLKRHMKGRKKRQGCVHAIAEMSCLLRCMAASLSV